ncbi:branched-chain amino acid ABC transporter permease [Aquabacter sp. CN5-332]|uniref:branched-chain amino acid ABC transporter permease n=1 Tax=Aquabacter sp. CN5-332 TaxID=3156608 RepID=UPI0032B316EB
MSDASIWLIRILFVAFLAAIPFMVDAYWLNMAILALIYSLVVYSITVLTGFTGLLSFGQAGFVGLGAYIYGVMSVKGVPPVAAAAWGIVLPTIVGFLLGLPAARLRGHYMAIGTLGFGVLVAQLLNNMVDVTRGPMGLLGIKSFGLDRVTWFYCVLALALVLLAALEYLDRRTFLGVVLKSVKYDEISASACGVGVFGVKLLAFSASAFLAGTCGVLLAAYMKFLTPDLFLSAESFRYLMMAVVGGVGSATGALVSTLILTGVPEALRAFGETNVRLLVYGLMVLFVLWFLPGGIGGLIDRLMAPRRKPRRTSASAPQAPKADTVPGRVS